MNTDSIEIGIEVDKLDQLVELFGAFDENAKAIEKETGASIVSRDHHIVIRGKQEDAELAHVVVDKLLGMARKREKIDISKIRYAVELARERKRRRHRGDHGGRHRHHEPRAAGEKPHHRAEALRQSDPREYRYHRDRAGGHRQDVSRHGDGRHGAEKQRGGAHHFDAPRGGGGREPGVSAGRSADQGGPVPSPAVRRAVRFPGRGQFCQAFGARCDRGRTARVHARAARSPTRSSCWTRRRTVPRSR